MGMFVHLKNQEKQGWNNSTGENNHILVLTNCVYQLNLIANKKNSGQFSGSPLTYRDFSSIFNIQ